MNLSFLFNNLLKNKIYHLINNLFYIWFFNIYYINNKKILLSIIGNKIYINQLIFNLKN